MFSLFSKVNFRRTISWLTPCLAHLSIQAAPIRWGDAWKTGMNSLLPRSPVKLSSPLDKLLRSHVKLLWSRDQVSAISPQASAVLRQTFVVLRQALLVLHQGFAFLRHASTCIFPHFIPTLPHAVIHLISSNAAADLPLFVCIFLSLSFISVFLLDSLFVFLPVCLTRL